MGQAHAIVDRYGSTHEALIELRELSSDALKTKLYLIAVDIALASGGIDGREGDMLSLLQSVLSVDDTTAEKIRDVLALKYA